LDKGNYCCALLYYLKYKNNKAIILQSLMAIQERRLQLLVAVKNTSDEAMKVIQDVITCIEKILINCP
jgi:hypothetical protein